MSRVSQTIAVLLSYAFFSQGCVSNAPTQAQSKVAFATEVMATALAEAEACLQSVTDKIPTPSLQNVMWNGGYAVMPISYLTNEQQLDDTQKAELAARTDATSICVARYGEQMSSIQPQQKSITTLYNDQVRLIAVTLIEDRITVGQYHEAMKYAVTNAEETQNTLLSQLSEELEGQHKVEIAQREAQREAAYQRFQQGLLNAAAVLNAGQPAYGNSTFSSPSINSIKPISQSSSGPLVRQEVSGFNKICYYNVLGSVKAKTIGSTQLCPLWD